MALQFGYPDSRRSTTDKLKVLPDEVFRREKHPARLKESTSAAFTEEPLSLWGSRPKDLDHLLLVLTYPDTHNIANSHLIACGVSNHRVVFSLALTPPTFPLAAWGYR